MWTVPLLDDGSHYGHCRHCGEKKWQTKNLTEGIKENMRWVKLHYQVRKHHYNETLLMVPVTGG